MRYDDFLLIYSAGPKATSEKGAQMFCRIRGYIAMVKKNSLPVLEVINDAFLNRPFMPQQ